MLSCNHRTVPIEANWPIRGFLMRTPGPRESVDADPARTVSLRQSRRKPERDDYLKHVSRFPSPAVLERVGIRELVAVHLSCVTPIIFLASAINSSVIRRRASSSLC